MIKDLSPEGTMRISLSLIFALLLGSTVLQAQDLYDINNVTVIELTFDDPNWDQTMDTYYSNNMDERLIASCTVNGIPYDSVGVKYKGNSTYNPNNDKNPLNIKLDYIIGSQDYDGWYTLKLSSGDKDPSFVREALSYEILRKYMVAPLSNFAKVYINGNYYGLFTSNESINKKFIEDYLYSDGDNTLIKCNPEVVMNGGSSLEYLGTDSSQYFEYYELKSDYGWNDLADFTNSLNNDFSNVESFMDIDRAIWMLAFNNVFVNLDSYTGPFKQNYYLFRDDHERMNAIVWDLNMSLGSFSMINLGGGGPGGPPDPEDLQEMEPLLRLGDNDFPLIDQILSNARYQKMYIAHCRTMLEENFVNDLYYERADEMQNLIYSDYDSDPSQIYSTANFISNLTSSVNVGGGPGNAPFIGLTELMDTRTSFLQSHVEYQKVPPTINTINTGTALPNSTVDITVDVSNSNYVYLGHRNSATEIFSKVEMFDDGAHNDGAAGDGVYGASIAVGASDVQYYIYSDNNDAGIFSPQRAEHEYHELAVTGDIVINEFMASNSSTQADQDGKYDDWIELYNNTPTSIDLSGFYLSDDAGDPLKWSFPSGTSIAGDGYLIIWADKDTTQAGLHANFKLSSNGEALYLSNASGSLKDEVVFPIQTTDVSYGRYPNGTGAFTSMPATYSAENSLDPLTGIDDLETEMDLMIYPNPVQDYFIVDFKSNGSLLVEVYNSIGERICQERVSRGTQINTSTWSSGVYFIQVDQRVSAKLMKH